ncbi:MAG: hypothetical protein ACRDN0_11105, partial [Trebonia sp.]
MTDAKGSRYNLPAWLRRDQGRARRDGPVSCRNGVVTRERDVGDAVSMGLKELLGSPAGRDCKLDGPLLQQRRMPAVTNGFRYTN